MSPELETLDQLLGGDLSVATVRTLFDADDRFISAVTAMLHAGKLRLSANDVEVPPWRWQSVLAGEPQARLSITPSGARSIR
jgi:hypothetical protein